MVVCEWLDERWRDVDGFEVSMLLFISVFLSGILRSLVVESNMVMGGLSISISFKDVSKSSISRMIIKILRLSISVIHLGLYSSQILRYRLNTEIFTLLRNSNLGALNIYSSSKTFEILNLQEQL